MKTIVLFIRAWFRALEARRIAAEDAEIRRMLELARIRHNKKRAAMDDWHRQVSGQGPIPTHTEPFGAKWGW